MLRQVFRKTVQVVVFPEEPAFENIDRKAAPDVRFRTAGGRNLVDIPQEGQVFKVCFRNAGFLGFGMVDHKHLRSGNHEVYPIINRKTSPVKVKLGKLKMAKDRGTGNPCTGNPAALYITGETQVYGTSVPAYLKPSP